MPRQYPCIASSPPFNAFASSLKESTQRDSSNQFVYRLWNMKVLCGYEAVTLPSFWLEMVTRRQWLVLLAAPGFPSWSVVWPLSLPAPNVVWPFCCGSYSSRKWRRGIFEPTWIYQPGFPVENRSGFMPLRDYFPCSPCCVQVASCSLSLTWAGTVSHQGRP